MRKSTKAGVVAGTVLALTGGGVAFAYWTTSGNGDGTASTGSDSGVSVTQLGSVAGLVPGGTAQNVNFTITNPASTNQYIGSVTMSKTEVTGPNIDTTHPCTVGDFEITQPTVEPGDLTSGDHDYVGNGATVRLVNSDSNQDGCKGATLTLAFTANAN